MSDSVRWASACWALPSCMCRPRGRKRTPRRIAFPRRAPPSWASSRWSTRRAAAWRRLSRRAAPRASASRWSQVCAKLRVLHRRVHVHSVCAHSPHRRPRADGGSYRAQGWHCVQTDAPRRGQRAGRARGGRAAGRRPRASGSRHGRAGAAWLCMHACVSEQADSLSQRHAAGCIHGGGMVGIALQARNCAGAHEPAAGAPPLRVARVLRPRC